MQTDGDALGSVDVMVDVNIRRWLRDRKMGQGSQKKALFLLDVEDD